jgi:zinc transporter ZupT
MRYHSAIKLTVMINMPLWEIKLIAAGLILLMTIIAGVIPFKKRLQSLKGHDFPIGEALACGVFLGAGLIHMLGDASNSFREAGYHYPFAFLLAGLCFLSLLLLEHASTELRHHQPGSSPSIAILAVVMLSIHALLAGMALGLSNSLTTTLVIAFAILAHKWAESFALSVQINKSSLHHRTGINLFVIFSIMTPIGVVFGDGMTVLTDGHSLLLPIFSSLAAGTFLYIGTLHGLARAILIQRCCNHKEFSCVVLGFLLMALVAIWT